MIVSKRVAAAVKTATLLGAAWGAAWAGLIAPPAVAQPAAPIVLSNEALDGVSAAGLETAFVLDTDSLALLQAFLNSLNGNLPGSVSVSQSEIPAPVPAPPPAPPETSIAVAAPAPIEPPSAAPIFSISATASATACCGPSASATTFISGVIDGQRFFLRDPGRIDANGRVTATSTFSFPLGAGGWKIGQ